MKIDITTTFTITDHRIDSLLAVIGAAVPRLTESLVAEVCREAGQRQMADGTLKKEYGPCIWKDSHGKRQGKLLTKSGWISIPHLIIQDKKTGKRHYITRRILGIEERRRIPRIMQRVLAALGTVSPYRVAQGILQGLSGIRTSLMAIQRSVCQEGTTVAAELSPASQEDRVLLADGTGVKIRGTGKRGAELKVLLQRGRDGMLRFLGVLVGQWHGGWSPLFKRFRGLGMWRRPLSLVTDGDHTICRDLKDSLPAETRVHRQRCTWHISREAGYMLWMDGHSKIGPITARKRLRTKVLNLVRKAAKVARMIPEKRSIEAKKRTGRKAMRYMKDALEMCKENKLAHTQALLTRFISERSLDGAIYGGVVDLTSSRLERLMHTLKRRTSVGGSWSAKGAQAVATLRLALYYNGWALEKHPNLRPKR